MAAHVIHVGGEMEPAVSELLESLVAELDLADDEHPDVSIEHESGWGLSAFPGGLLVWENVEDGDAPHHMTGVSRSETLRHFHAVLDGDLDTVHRLPWSPGYG